MPIAFKPVIRADLVASNLEQLIQAQPDGQLYTAPTSRFLALRRSLVRVVCDSAASFESRRQEKDLADHLLVPDAASPRCSCRRDRYAQSTKWTSCLLPDATQARIVYRNTASYDQAQNALLYRRDLIYTVEYATSPIAAAVDAFWCI